MSRQSASFAGRFILPASFAIPRLFVQPFIFQNKSVQQMFLLCRCRSLTYRQKYISITTQFVGQDSTQLFKFLRSYYYLHDSDYCPYLGCYIHNVFVIVLSALLQVSFVVVGDIHEISTMFSFHFPFLGIPYILVILTMKYYFTFCSRIELR